jgi:uncharacterized membrane protein
LSETSTNNYRKTFFLTILLAYKNFSLSYSLAKKNSSGERWLLFLSFMAALILFLANLPYQIAVLPSFIGGNTSFYIGILAFTAVFFMPLFLYLLSAVLFVILKLFNGRSSFYELRLAIFWSINVAGPILIINGLLKGFFFQTEKLFFFSLILDTFVGWIFANMVAEAEQFSSKYPVFFASVFFIALPQLRPLI